MSPAKLDLRAALSRLEGLDGLESPSILLGAFEEDRPLCGACGYCDWRLNGRLSALVRDYGFRCQTGEVVLTDTAGRLPAERILIFGLGSRTEMDLEGFRRALGHMLQVSHKAGLDDLAIELPGAEAGLIEEQQAIEVLLELACERCPGGRITVLCPSRRFADLLAECAGRAAGVRMLGERRD
ncbi:MAG: hypothetical protein JXR96_27680 [Deltaproteobacteria bacterium]|nr:hypothetical protein [Deltaproteobacteria bacterium]